MFQLKQSKIPDYLKKYFKPVPGIPAKSMCCIPERFCIRMLDAGWILRQKIIWAKGISFCETYAGSCMPDSAKDRFNKNGFEPLYFFTKTGKYWFEQQYEDASESNAERPRMGQGNQTIYNQKRRLCATSPKHNDAEKSKGTCSLMADIAGKEKYPKRILRNIWAINPEPSSDKHYAAYPKALVEPCIKAGCPKEICSKCNKPRVPIYDKGELVADNPNYKPRGNNRGDSFVQNAMTPAGETKGHPNFHYELKNISYSDCQCGEPFEAGIVLDPFGGTCRTGVVAMSLGRRYVMIEGKPEYIEDIANHNLTEVSTGVPVKEQRQGQKALFEVKQ